MIPELICVGSGRCGTLAFSEFCGGEHEPNQEPVVQLASSVSHGWVTPVTAAAVMSQFPWPRIVVDYKQSELIPSSRLLWPDVQYVWLVRNPADTVASMVANNWYLPSDDAYPPGYMTVYNDAPPEMYEDDMVPFQVQTVVNDAGHRTRGDLTGEFTFNEWSAMGQVERCGWWWNHVNRRIRDTAPDGTILIRLEDAVEAGEDFGSELLGTPKALPAANESTTRPVTGWEPWVTEMARYLGYA